MPHRSHLRQALQTAWQLTVDGPYRRQEINSERGLQVHLCTALLPLLKEKPRRLFIEPRVHVEGKEGFVCPDLLVCSQRAVIGVVELKYTPRGRPSVEGDLSKLRAFAYQEGTVEIFNERFLGKRRSLVRYTFARDALLCWAGIYTGKQLELVPPESAKLKGRMLAMHAITKHGEHATVVSAGAPAIGERSPSLADRSV